MRSIRQACLTLLLAVAALPAFADTIDFRHLPDVPGAGGEISGDEFADQGLQLTMLDGLSFNVGCGTIVSCLGADLETPDDFQGGFRGTFVSPDTGAPMSVLSFQIDYCCSTLKPFPTVTRLFDSGGQLIGVFTDTDVSYFGHTPVASFEASLGYDAMYSMNFERYTAPAVPEPTSLALLLGGVGLLLARRRGQA